MPIKKYLVALADEERQQLETIARSNRRSLREKTRARILLLADANRDGGGLKDADIAQRIRCTALTVGKVRQRTTERGCVAAIEHKQQGKRKPRALDGQQEARLIALTCSAPPDGRKRWTLRLLKERLIEMEVVESIAGETIRRTLKKTNSSPG